MRTVRVDADVWDAAAAVAEDRGETVSDVIRRSLAAYVKRHTPRTDPGCLCDVPHGPRPGCDGIPR
jgi:negative regulator of replication initiation